MSIARYPEWQAEAAATLIAPIVAAESGPVLLCLQAVQAHFGYVPGDAVGMIAEACNVSRADVHGVFTFYADLRDTSPPAVPVRLCAAEACQAVGGRKLKTDWATACGEDAELAALTGVDEPIFCLGNCALGPAALVDGELMGCADVARLKGAVTQAQAAVEAS
ncbi:MAG: NADH-quinone oxidoreductase subunit E [Halieaceae bacterium]|jgi:formate dehydrogenase subunit gamma|nr:NADH-quinone oxidoreductase subunit E [Halieaceae bacterium]|tara:strand:+ start:259 stop:750 length:492 start_codon:yes stop_codon:yes gene_type:complete